MLYLLSWHVCVRVVVYTMSTAHGLIHQSACVTLNVTDSISTLIPCLLFRVMQIFEGNNIGQQISEHFTSWKEPTLLAKKPIPNWPEQFGQLAAEAINQEGLAGGVKLLVAHGGVGRTTLELLRNCQDLMIDHTDATANTLQVLEQLLEQSRVQWYEKVFLAQTFKAEFPQVSAARGNPERAL